MEELFDNLKEYINTRIRLSKLTIIEKGVTIFSSLVTVILIGIFLILAFLFVSIALGFYISELIGNTYGGFFIVSLFYFLMAVLVLLLKQKFIEKPIINTMIKKIFKEEEE